MGASGAGAGAGAGTGAAAGVAAAGVAAEWPLLPKKLGIDDEVFEEAGAGAAAAAGAGVGVEPNSIEGGLAG